MVGDHWSRFTKSRFLNICSLPAVYEAEDLQPQIQSGVDRSAQTRQVHIKSPRIHLHTPPIPTCSRWYDHEWLKADYKPDSPPLPNTDTYSWCSKQHLEGNSLETNIYFCSSILRDTYTWVISTSLSVYPRLATRGSYTSPGTYSTPTSPPSTKCVPPLSGKGSGTHYMPHPAFR